MALEETGIVKLGHASHAPVGRTYFKPLTSSHMILAHSSHWEEGQMKERLRTRKAYEELRKECGAKIKPDITEGQHANVHAKWEEFHGKREHTNLNKGSKARQAKELKYKLEREGKDISNFKFEEEVTFMQYKEGMFHEYQRMRKQVGLPDSRYIPPEEDRELKKKQEIHAAEKRRKHQQEMIERERKALRDAGQA